MSLDVMVYGTPAPQGSKRHVGHGVMIEQSARVKPWREAVKHAALEQKPETITGPVRVRLTFLFVRPKSHFRTGRNAGRLRPSAPMLPATRPDLDKLVRSTLDALKDAGVYGDDGQVVQLVAAKDYVGMPWQRGPGALVTVEGLS